LPLLRFAANQPNAAATGNRNQIRSCIENE
jgi:hypothetical protein